MKRVKFGGGGVCVCVCGGGGGGGGGGGVERKHISNTLRRVLSSIFCLFVFFFFKLNPQIQASRLGHFLGHSKYWNRWDYFTWMI